MLNNKNNTKILKISFMDKTTLIESYGNLI